MGLQAGLWAEMRVSVNIKQELPGRVRTHQLQRPPNKKEKRFGINSESINRSARNCTRSDFFCMERMYEYALSESVRWKKIVIFQVVITALLHVFGECECHRFEYLAWLSTSKSVGSLRSPNLEILVQFFKKQTDSARSGFESDFNFTCWAGIKVPFENTKFWEFFAVNLNVIQHNILPNPVSTMIF
jgi:hypothetical protein